MADVKFVTYCMNHGYFVHEEEVPHLDVYPEHVLVEFMVTEGFYDFVGNFINDNIVTPVSGTQTVAVSGFDTVEDALNYIIESGVDSLNSMSGTPTTSLSGYDTLESAIIDLQDGKVDRDGDTMTDFLTLHANPTESGHAATKQYVDWQLANAGDKALTLSFTSGGGGGDDDDDDDDDDDGGGGVKPYVEVQSRYYTVAAKFIYNGVNLLGIPSSMKVSYEVQRSSKPGSIRIYDVTNGNTVVTKTGLTSTSETVVDLGTLSNLPPGPATFELQMKTRSNSKWIRASSLSMEF
jgi:hypothetical protein